VVLRPARLIDAALYGHLVAQRGATVARRGPIDTGDARSLVEVMWCDAAAVLVAELDARPIAVSTVFDLDLLHRTAWIDVLHAVDSGQTEIDAVVAELVSHVFTTWPLRTLRTAQPPGSPPVLTTFREHLRFEGVVPGRCPGIGNGDAEVRALWRTDVRGLVRQEEADA
jgi:hypothetical protein